MEAVQDKEAWWTALSVPPNLAANVFLVSHYSHTCHDCRRNACRGSGSFEVPYAVQIQYNECHLLHWLLSGNVRGHRMSLVIKTSLPHLNHLCCSLRPNHTDASFLTGCSPPPTYCAAALAWIREYVVIKCSCGWAFRREWKNLSQIVATFTNLLFFFMTVRVYLLTNEDK